MRKSAAQLVEVSNDGKLAWRWWEVSSLCEASMQEKWSQQHEKKKKHVGLQSHLLCVYAHIYCKGRT